MLKTRLLSPIQKQMTDEHGEPDVIIEDKELKSKHEDWMPGLYSLLLSKFRNDIDIIHVPNPLSLDDEIKSIPIDGTDLGFTITNGIITNLIDYTYERKPVIEINSEGFSYAHIKDALFTFVIIDGQPVHIKRLSDS